MFKKKIRKDQGVLKVDDIQEETYPKGDQSEQLANNQVSGDKECH